MDRSSNVRKTIIEMFDQREYKDLIFSDTRIIATKPSNDLVCVFCEIITKLNVAEIKSHIAILQELSILHGILVYDGTSTPAVKNIIDNIPNLSMDIELFSADDLQFNVTKHILVPKHILLSKEDANIFKKTHGLKIPIILHTDPISRFYNFHKKDIVKIIRRNGHTLYRLVA